MGALLWGSLVSAAASLVHAQEGAEVPGYRETIAEALAEYQDESDLHG